MEKLIFTKLDPAQDVLSERVTIRITPQMKADFESLAAATNRDVASCYRMALEWALERIEIEEE